MLRSRTYLLEGVAFPFYIENDRIRAQVGTRYIVVRDLRHAGERGKTVDMFVVNFDRNKASSKPIVKNTRWLGRARSYAQALSVFYDALKEAETIAAQHGEVPPWLEERVVKAVYIPAAGTDMSKVRVRPSADIFGTLKATTRGQSKSPVVAKNQGGRPTTRKGIRARNHAGGNQPGDVEGPKGDKVVNFPKLFDYQIIVNGKASGTMRAPNALKALQKAGFHPDLLSNPAVARVIKGIGLKADGYGKMFGIDIFNLTVAIRSDVAPKQSAATPEKKLQVVKGMDIEVGDSVIYKRKIYAVAWVKEGVVPRYIIIPMYETSDVDYIEVANPKALERNAKRLSKGQFSNAFIQALGGPLPGNIRKEILDGALKAGIDVKGWERKAKQARLGMDEEPKVADIILKQLGGHKFIVMTGANNMIGGKKSLSFRLPRAMDGINHVEIRLEPSDTYRVIFSRVTNGLKRGPKQTVKVDVDDIYADNLAKVFEMHTGLATSL